MALVTVVGGMGFIGARLSAELRAKGDTVRIVDVSASGDDDMLRFQADVRDRCALAAILSGSDVVYNLAAVHRDDVKPATLYEDVNVVGAANVCCVCRELGISKIIFTSSAAVYGLGSLGASEETVADPTNAYGYSKLRAEQVYRDWQAEEPKSRSLVIVRPTVVFGEGNRGNVYQLIRQIKSRRFIMVGSGRNRKSMAYVGNVSAFLVYVLSLGAGFHLFNYVDGPDLSMKELVQTVSLALGRRRRLNARIPYVVGYLFGTACDVVAAVTGKRLPISAVRIRKFCSTTTFSPQRAKSTGFRPPIGLRDALVKTVKHEVYEGARSDSAPID